MVWFVGAAHIMRERNVRNDGAFFNLG